MTASGQLSLPLENLRTLIANSATFRTWVGVATVALAKNHIYKSAVATPSGARPFVFIDHDGDGREIVGWPNTQLPRGTMTMVFEDDRDVADTTEEAIVESFTNTVGAVIAEMLALAGTDDYLLVRDISMTSPPARSDESSQYDIVQCQFSVEWGI